jgi:hypothetical protein
MFLFYLDKTGQQHVVNELLNDAAVAISPLTARGKDDDAYGKLVVQQFAVLMQSSSVDKRKLICSELTESLAELGEDNERVVFENHSRIQIFITSTSLSGLAFLREIYSNNKLKTTIQKIFCLLINHERRVTIDELIWDIADYNRCARYLSESIGPSVYTKIYTLSLVVITEPSAFS